MSGRLPRNYRFKKYTELKSVHTLPQKERSNLMENNNSPIQAKTIEAAFKLLDDILISQEECLRIRTILHLPTADLIKERQRLDDEAKIPQEKRNRIIYSSLPASLKDGTEMQFFIMLPITPGMPCYTKLKLYQYNGNRKVVYETPNVISIDALLERIEYALAYDITPKIVVTGKTTLKNYEVGIFVNVPKEYMDSYVEIKPFAAELIALVMDAKNKRDAAIHHNSKGKVPRAIPSCEAITEAPPLKPVPAV